MANLMRYRLPNSGGKTVRSSVTTTFPAITRPLSRDRRHHYLLKRIISLVPAYSSNIKPRLSLIITKQLFQHILPWGTAIVLHQRPSLLCIDIHYTICSYLKRPTTNIPALSTVYALTPYSINSIIPSTTTSCVENLRP